MTVVGFYFALEWLYFFLGCFTSSLSFGQNRKLRMAEKISPFVLIYSHLQYKEGHSYDSDDDQFFVLFGYLSNAEGCTTVPI